MTSPPGPADLQKAAGFATDDLYLSSSTPLALSRGNDCYHNPTSQYFMHHAPRRPLYALLCNAGSATVSDRTTSPRSSGPAHGCTSYRRLKVAFTSLQ